MTKLLIEFPQLVKESHSWIRESVEPFRKQECALTNFTNLLLKHGNNDASLKNNPEFKSLSQKVVDECMTNNTKHSLYFLGRRSQLGILNPVEKVIVTIEQILNYLDILHYGSFISNISCEPKDLKFHSRRIK